MKFSNNPQSVYNGAISGQRNMFLSSSLAAIMIGFSDKFDNHMAQITVKIIGALIFILSVTIGYLSNYDFRFYLDRVKDELPDYIPIENWYIWSFVVYIYTTLIAIVGLLFFLNKIIFAKK